MAKQLKSEKNGKDIDKKIDSLKEFAASLLEEIRALKYVEENQIREGIDFYEEVENFEIQLIEAALHKAGGNQKGAARLLNLKPSTLNMKIKTLKLKGS
jgi:transcriptional regulator with GAF, ATPase, and Fis domain